MINKVVNQLVMDMLEFFNSRNIKLTAQYSPDLGSISRYARDYMLATMDSPWANRDCAKYQNRLMYNISTPVTDPTKFNNLKSRLFSKLSDFNYTKGIVYSIDNPSADKYEAIIRKDRIKNPQDKKDGTVITRVVSWLNLPVHFMIMSESIDNIYDILLLIKQEVEYFNYLDVPLNLTPWSEEPDIIEYFMMWDTREINIGFADFQSTSLHTIEFSCTVSGGFFSNFYKEDSMLDRVELNIGFSNAQGKNIKQD